MNLQTAIEGASKGLAEPVVGMHHLLFCLVSGLILFTQRKRPRDMGFYFLGLIPGYGLEWIQPFPSVLVNVMVALSVAVILLLQWLYEKMAPYTLVILLIAGFFHGLSFSKAVAGSSISGFVSYATSASLVQWMLIRGFGLFAHQLSLRSPDGLEAVENILSAVGAGVALAYFVLAF